MRLHLITPPWRADLPALLEEALAADESNLIAALQIRLKSASVEAIRHAVAALAPIARRKGASVLLNDAPRLAAELGLDGVHIGQQDGSIRTAREIIGRGRILGVTCHDSLELARRARRDGADYVAFGAFFPSRTKPQAAPARLQTLFRWQREGGRPCVAIGGITPDNALMPLRAGADFLAVNDGIWGYDAGPGEAVRAFAKISALPKGNKEYHHANWTSFSDIETNV